MNEFILLKQRIKRVKEMGWIKCDNKNSNIAGITLERLIGNAIVNFPIADFYGIEIKSHYLKGTSKITLFSATPDSFLFENKRLVSLYGYPDKQFPQFKVLNNIVSCNSLTYMGNNIYFSLEVNRIQEKLVLNVFRGPFELIDDLTSWSFELLEERINMKLKNLCYVNFDKNIYNNELYVKYTSEKYYKYKGFDNFINLLENGKIYIRIKLGVYKSGKKFGQLHDHGTSFDINEADLELLYEDITNLITISI